MTSSAPFVAVGLVVVLVVAGFSTTQPRNHTDAASSGGPPRTFLLSVDEAFELGRLTNEVRIPDALKEQEAAR